ncbi:MAG: hypothetical protein Kow0098_01310 [Ignavibacteriaceae bacterium]
MNIQKIFKAVGSDEINSPLPSIVREFEQQGYRVKIEELEVSSLDMNDQLFEDLKRATSEFEIEILNESEPSQNFKLVFTDYHKFNFQPC